MKVHDYQIIKFVQTLLLDPAYYNTVWLKEKHVAKAQWRIIEIIKQVREKFPIGLREAKELVSDHMLEAVLNDEKLYEKFKPKTE